MSASRQDNPDRVGNHTANAFGFTSLSYLLYVMRKADTASVLIVAH